MVIRYNNELFTITEFHHVSPGNWRAFVRANLKNLRTGRVIEVRFRAGEEIDAVRVEHQNWQFLYVDGDDYYFMYTDRKSTRSELQSHSDLVCPLMLEKKNFTSNIPNIDISIITTIQYINYTQITII